jgi:hypothetical protein
VDKTQNPYDYGGEQPESEAETIILENLLAANKDAFLVLNHHGTESITDGKKVYYTASCYHSDNNAQHNSSRMIDAVLKNKLPWLLTDVPANASKNLVQITSRGWHGSFDSYFNHQLGLHGYLMEISDVAGADYPSATAVGLQSLGVCATGNILISALIQNQCIVGSNNCVPFDNRVSD